MKVEMTKEHLNSMTDTEFEEYMNRDSNDMEIDEIRKHWENTGKKKKEPKVCIACQLSIKTDVLLNIWHIISDTIKFLAPMLFVH